MGGFNELSIIFMNRYNINGRLKKNMMDKWLRKMKKQYRKDTGKYATANMQNFIDWLRNSEDNND